MRREREGEGRFLSVETVLPTLCRAKVVEKRERGGFRWWCRFDKGKSFEAAALGERVISPEWRSVESWLVTKLLLR